MGESRVQLYRRQLTLVQFERRLLRFGAVWLASVLVVVSQGTVSERGSPSLIEVARAQPASANVPVQWERAVRGTYENKGVARIERLGERWTLSVWCRGTHSTYLDDTTEDLNRYANLFVTVRYSYVTRETADPKCLRGPCSPFRERLISIRRITPLKISVEEARKRDRECK